MRVLQKTQVGNATFIIGEFDNGSYYVKSKGTNCGTNFHEYKFISEANHDYTNRIENHKRQILL